MTLECRYLPPGAPEIKAHTDQYRVRLEVPSVSGCCFAIGREVYDRLGGLAEEMLCYGVEDFDLALSAWLANAGPATFPDLVVYHRYQSQYLSYSIDMREVKANHLRCAYSHIGRSDRPATVKLWGAWCNAARERWGESLFEDAWSRFKATISVTDARRSRVEQLARRTGRTLEDYATRFDLGWPA
jgi:GT2 family glycosyltransferase